MSMGVRSTWCSPFREADGNMCFTKITPAWTSTASKSGDQMPCPRVLFQAFQMAWCRLPPENRCRLHSCTYQAVELLYFDMLFSHAVVVCAWIPPLLGSTASVKNRKTWGNVVASTKLLFCLDAKGRGDQSARKRIEKKCSVELP